MKRNYWTYRKGHWCTYHDDYFNRMSRAYCPVCKKDMFATTNYTKVEDETIPDIVCTAKHECGATMIFYDGSR